MHEFARSQEAIATGQIRGLIFVFIAVGCVLVFTLRNFRISAVTLAVNVIPIGMGFGAMGWLGIPLDAGTVVVGTIAFGIAVDDSIHAAVEFANESQMGADPLSALRSAYEIILPPVVISTAVIIAGFLVLACSDFLLIRNLGAVTASVMALCLATDLTLLPILLHSASTRITGTRERIS
jgi:predicted RND superfamily exporter protein